VSERDGRTAAAGSATLNRKRSAAVRAVLLLAVVLFAHKVSLALGNPFFGGDAGHRMNLAWSPVALLDHRVWLPFLQFHLALLYHLRLPVPAYALIPCVYFFLAVLFLGLVSLRILGRAGGGSLPAMFLMGAFAYQQAVAPCSVQLYQEILGSALFFWLLQGGALDLRKSRFLLLLAAAALITRETFWIYLLVVTALNLRRLRGDRRLGRAFLLLWAIPALWLLSIPFGYLIARGRFPVVPTEWPLTINKQGGRALSDLGSSAGHLLDSLVASRALYLAAAVLAAWAVVTIGAARRRSPLPPDGSFAARFVPFSLLALAIVHALILLFDPWQATGGSPRIGFTLIEHGFIWCAVLYAASASLAPGRKVVARALLAAGLLAGISLNPTTWIPEAHAEARRQHAEIRRLVERVAREHTPAVAFVGESYWDAVRRFVAPTLRARRVFYAPAPEGTGPPDEIAADIVVVRGDCAYRPGDRYEKHGEYVLEETAYVVYVRRTSGP
jgi:hypothetical protein